MSYFLTDTPHVSPLTNDSRAALAKPRPDHISGCGWRGRLGRAGAGMRSRPRVDSLGEVGKCLSLQAGGGGATEVGSQGAHRAAQEGKPGCRTQSSFPCIQSHSS